jgi:predicted branched-subunit amino acid permease
VFSKPRTAGKRIVGGMNTPFHRIREVEPAIGAVRDGARAMAPWLIGIAPLGFAIGVSTARADVPACAGWLAGPLIFSASGQAVTIQLLDRHAAAVVVITGGLAVNLRLVLYSAAMARHWRARPAWWNALAACTLVDPSAAVALAGYERSDDPAYGDAHYVGAAATLAIAWLASIALGATFGAALPRGLRLELVIPLYLVGQLVRRTSDATAKHAATVAVVLALIGAAAPLHLGTLIAITGGTLVAITTGDRTR